MKDAFLFEAEPFEAYGEFEEPESFDMELADEGEEEARRFGRMPRRAARPLPRRGPRIQRRALPRGRIRQQPKRPPKRPPRWPVRPRWPMAMIQQPAYAEPEEQGSEYVRWVQRSLNQVLGLNLPVTGVMNAATRSALRKFQRQQGLRAAGSVGPDTKRALVRAKAKSARPRAARARAVRPNAAIRNGAQPGFAEPSAAEPGPAGPSAAEPDFAEPSAAEPRTQPDSAEPSATEPDSAEPGAAEPNSVEPGSAEPGAGPSEEPPSSDEFEWLGLDEFAWPEKGEDELFGFEAQAPEVGLAQLPESVGRALRAGFEKVALKLAVAAGVLDETLLTNAVFHARHPERRARPLSKREAGFERLSREWLDIRNGLVRPALRSRPASGAATRMPPSAATGALDIVKVRGIGVARHIAPKVEALLRAAEADGIALSGWGYRSREKQIELRRKHCGPTDDDIYRKPASQCTPPTATPGKSMHERGLAIDFTYNGKTIKSRNSPAFQWLSRNANRFYLFNLPSEPWHWSVNGR